MSATQLNASSGGVAGTFAYTPAAGTILAAGSQTLSVTFTPTDLVDYTVQTATVTLLVNKAALTVTPNPASRLYGVANPVFTGIHYGHGRWRQDYGHLRVGRNGGNAGRRVLDWSQRNCGNTRRIQDGKLSNYTLTQNLGDVDYYPGDHGTYVGDTGGDHLRHATQCDPA